jgi:hypothetical protein
MSKVVKLEPGIDPTQQPNKLPERNAAGRLLVIAAIGLVLALACAFFAIPWVSAKVNPPTPSGVSSPSPQASPKSTSVPGVIHQVNEPAGPQPRSPEPVETIEVVVTQLVPVTQIVSQSNTIIVTRVISGPEIVKTQIVQFPVTQLIPVTRVIPVTQIIIQTSVWIITATPQPPTMTATAFWTSTPTQTATASPTATPTPTGTATPIETETVTP